MAHLRSADACVTGDNRVILYASLADARCLHRAARAVAGFIDGLRGTDGVSPELDADRAVLLALARVLKDGLQVEDEQQGDR